MREEGRKRDIGAVNPVGRKGVRVLLPEIHVEYLLTPERAYFAVIKQSTIKEFEEEEEPQEIIREAIVASLDYSNLAASMTVMKVLF